MLVHIIAISVTLITVFVKAYWDSENWGHVNHTVGIGLVALILVPICFYIHNPYPLFLFGATFNLVINKIRGLPTFYVGNSSFTDKMLRKIFIKNPGESFVILNFLLLIFFLGRLE